MNSLESVADAIMSFEGWKPGTKSYINRNPGNLRSANEDYLVYQSLVYGYQALLEDLTAKFTGHTHSGLTPDSTLFDLMAVYSPSADGNPTTAYAQFIANWCTKALGIQVTPATKLKDIWSPAAPVTVL
jgi:hypothetical protein